MDCVPRHRKTTTPAENKEPLIELTLYSSSDNAHHGFSVPARMTVGDFLELALDRLAQGESGDRVQTLRNYYEPVLELPSPDGDRELPVETSLAEAGLYDQAVCRIAARPRKERIMFCSYLN